MTELFEKVDPLRPPRRTEGVARNVAFEQVCLKTFTASEKMPRGLGLAPSDNREVAPKLHLDNLNSIHNLNSYRARSPAFLPDICPSQKNEG